MLQKIFVICFVLLILSTSVNAQRFSKKYMIIIEEEDKVVYIDTSSAKLQDNQLSVWSMVYHKSPIMVNPFQQLVTRVKTQFLINNVTNKYSVIGTLYYDEKGRIIGENSTPKITGGNDNFMMAVQPGTLIETIKEKTLEIISEDNLTYTTVGTESDTNKIVEINPTIDSTGIDSTIGESSLEDFTFNPNENNEETPEANTVIPIINNLTVNKDGYPLDPDLNIQTININEDSLNNNDNNGIETYQTDNNINSDPESQINSTEEVETPVINDPVENEPEVTDYKYNGENEKQVSGFFFTDGVKYCFQMSSFKTRSVAVSEMEKYIRQGHNAFIVEKYIPKRRATYNRVRIGIFDSLQEAKDYKRRNRL